MKMCNVRVVHHNGVHAGPTSKIVRLASQFKSDIWIEKDGDVVNAKSSMGISMLGIGVGETVTLSAEGADEETAVEALQVLLRSDFGENW